MTASDERTQVGGVYFGALELDDGLHVPIIVISNHPEQQLTFQMTGAVATEREAREITQYVANLWMQVPKEVHYNRQALDA